MRRAFHSWRGRIGPILNRLDRIAQLINPLLFIVVLVLALIDVSCFTALRIAHLHPHGMITTAIH